MSLLIPTPTDDTTEPRKIIAKRSRNSFNLTMDPATHLKLVNLQRQFSNPDIRPSRTLICRLALRRLAIEVRAREMRGDREWFKEQAEELQHLALAGAK